MKLYFKDCKDLKKAEYELFKKKTKNDWIKFDKIRRPFYNSFAERNGPFYKQYDDKVALAFVRYLKAIEKPLRDYNNFCEAIDSLLKVKEEINCENKKELRAIVLQEAKRINSQKW